MHPGTCPFSTSRWFGGECNNLTHGCWLHSCTSRLAGSAKIQPYPPMAGDRRVCSGPGLPAGTADYQMDQLAARCRLCGRIGTKLFLRLVSLRADAAGAEQDSGLGARLLRLSPGASLS